MSPDELQIHEAHASWIVAVNGGDLDRLLSLTTEDVVFINPGQEPFGHEEFSIAVSEAHQRLRLLCTSELEEVVVSGEVAYTRSRDSLSLTDRAGGETTCLAGYRMTVYRKQDGRWLLARDAHTLAPSEMQDRA